MKSVALKKKRLAALIISVALGIAAAIASYVMLKLSVPLSIFAIVFVCIPAIWQLFFMPVYLHAKHYFFAAGQYLLFWGGPLLLYAVTFHKSDFIYIVGYIYLGAVLLLWGLGAFLRGNGRGKGI